VGVDEGGTVFSKPIRVSPAMGVALVALAFAVSGTSLAQGAASKIGRLLSGAAIKKGSIPGNRLAKGGVSGDRIKSNSLTGKQIDEKTLAKVASATRADRVTLADRATNAQRATNADNALALGGTAAAGYLSFASRGIPSGTTVTGAFGIGANVTAAVTVAIVPPPVPDPNTTPTNATATTAMTGDIRQVVQLPGPAPADLSDATVNFANADAGDADASCTGTAVAPTAPAGKVCLYLSNSAGAATVVDGEAIPGLAGSRNGFVVHATNAALGETGAFGTWAYTAP
jgi:hypothetical protein